MLKNATILLAATNDFLRISLVYLNTNVLKRLGQVLISEDDVTKGKDAFNSALKDFLESLNMAASLTLLRKEQEEQQKATLTSLSEMNFEVVQHDVLKKRKTGTGQWLLEATEFQDRLQVYTPLLWCPRQGMSITLRSCEEHLSLTGRYSSLW
jgi:hypothetical protein